MGEICQFSGLPWQGFFIRPLGKGQATLVTTKAQPSCPFKLHSMCIQLLKPAYMHALIDSQAHNIYHSSGRCYGPNTSMNELDINRLTSRSFGLIDLEPFPAYVVELQSCQSPKMPTCRHASREPGLKLVVPLLSIAD